MGWMWLFGVLLLVGLVLLIGLGVRALGGGISRDVAADRPSAPPAGRSPAREILEERYARGELTTQEYQQRLGVLGEGR